MTGYSEQLVERLAELEAETFEEVCDKINNLEEQVEVLKKLVEFLGGPPQDTRRSITH